MVERIFAELATRLADAHKSIPAGIRDHLLMHYAGPAQALPANISPKARRSLANAIERLRATDR